MNSNQNKIILITGGGGDIGKAMATQFLKNSFTVIILDVNRKILDSAKEELSSLGRIFAYKVDVTKKEEIQVLKEKIFAQLGPIHVLINNAATFSVIAPTEKADPDKWIGDVSVNLNGSFLMARHFLPDLISQNSGFVINVVSTGGVGDPHPYCTSYACSKAGLMRLTEGMAKELEQAKKNIFVFALAPPAVRTKMTEFIMNDEGGKKYRPNFERFLENPSDCANPEDVANQAVKLVTVKEAQKLSGRLIKVKDSLEELLQNSDRIIKEDLRTLRIRY